MKIKDREFVLRDGALRFFLFRSMIEALENIGVEGGGIASVREQIAIAKQLEDATNGEADLSIEQLSLVRSLFERSSVIPVVKLALYDALDPPQE